MCSQALRYELDAVTDQNGLPFVSVVSTFKWRNGDLVIAPIFCTATVCCHT